jgi:putative tryptophan/tyrosine transport system substrate-binding protein
LQLFTTNGPGEFTATFAAIKQSGADALLVLSDALFNAARREIIRLAAQHRLPTMFEAREFVEDGGLIAYGPNIAEMTRRSALLIVKVLKGSNPGELPIEQPTTFELIVNVQTGKALGIATPPAVLLRADKVIE